MDKGLAGRYLGMLFASLLLMGCAGSASESPASGPLDLPAVTAALQNAGIAVIEVADDLDPRDGAWRCLPGSFRLARISQQRPAAFAHPGDRPSVEVLLFPSDAERATAEKTIGVDGQVQTPGCAMMVDWVATPHVVGVRNDLLFVVTDDPASLAAVDAAASRLGG
jgi:hypothetical protein